MIFILYYLTFIYLYYTKTNYNTAFILYIYQIFYVYIARSRFIFISVQNINKKLQINAIYVNKKRIINLSSLILFNFFLILCRNNILHIEFLFEIFIV